MRALLTLLRRSELDVTKSFVFLDAAYTLPTASGMPLELTANGSATLGLQVRPLHTSCCLKPVTR